MSVVIPCTKIQGESLPGFFLVHKTSPVLQVIIRDQIFSATVTVDLCHARDPSYKFKRFAQKTRIPQIIGPCIEVKKQSGSIRSFPEFFPVVPLVTKTDLYLVLLYQQICYGGYLVVTDLLKRNID